MLAGPSEQEKANTVDLFDNTYAHQTMENKSNWNSKAFYLREILRGPVVWYM